MQSQGAHFDVILVVSADSVYQPCVGLKWFSNRSCVKMCPQENNLNDQIYLIALSKKITPINLFQILL